MTLTGTVRNTTNAKPINNAATKVKIKNFKCKESTINLVSVIWMAKGNSYNNNNKI